MTWQCAWCGEILSVNLLALLRCGLSHGICRPCLPRWIGRGK